MSFIQKLQDELSSTKTTNGAKAYNTTGNKVLDFFGCAGSMRNKSEDEITKLFYEAFFENRVLATKCLFYLRDIRGGQGERRTFRVILKDLAFNYHEIVKMNIDNISQFGRYDDLLVLLDTPLASFVAEYIKEQLRKDIGEEHPSLLAKWLPSPTTSSKESRRLARKLCRLLNFKESRYRKLLSTLRKRIRVTEALISANKWEELNLEGLTANNYIKYKNAFMKHIPDQFEEYMKNVKEGNSNIKSATLYPYDIVRKVRYTSNQTEKDVLNEMWKALPNYLEGDTSNIAVVVDTSGSMLSAYESNVKPLDVAISLGLFISERNKGAFHNHFITFANKPELVKVKGNTLHEKVLNMARANWGMSTNLEATFDLILRTAVNNKLSQDEIPERLLIISDMQFNKSSRENDQTLFEEMKVRFEEAGYKLPILVFWNVDSKAQTFQVKKDNHNVLLASGCSPVLMKQVLKYNNPIDMMMDVLMSERYSIVK